MTRPPRATVWDAVLGQARSAPAATAMRSADRDITYRELTDRAEHTAGLLRAACPPGSLVALDATGHTAAAVAVLATARAGCAVLPLGATDPPRRRERVLRHAAPGCLLREAVPGEADLTVHGPPEAALPSRAPDLADIAYVMYTSGSTGEPKGVLVPHTALTDRLRGLAARPGLGAGESMAAVTALSFDIVMAEILLPLTLGARVDVAPPEARIDPAAFAAFAEQRRPDVVQGTPSFWRLLLAWGWKGLPDSRLWCGGEALTASLGEQLLPRCARLWNLYGPTEATIWASADRVRAPGSIGLGTPLPGSGMFLDPPGEGEVTLYGQGLADGYLDAPEATAERFPRLDTPDGPRRCYRTGDRARLRPDGVLEFLGRTDTQVKLRGHRVELGAVEAALEEHPDIVEAAALLGDTDRPAHTHIVAHVVFSSAAVSRRELRGWLAERLPAVSRPARIVERPALPRTAAGKIDRVRLAAEASVTVQAAVAAEAAVTVEPGEDGS
ncbi:amino acid adenylation domain-containing protein [Streptomyces sp. NPDC094038]|uniref:amino acid adenylation domain-containing protein n=1 Tax=Streptomyces sp. NPDC094038 TaxID=3366055 RepID=UPI0038005B7D